ncbi:MAG: spore germination protein [Clostridiales bacterium]|jgi:spore germination protein|nr:spore germination protein [Clostridiales bacterium]
MFSMNNKISVRQLQILLIIDIFGTGVIILPRRAVEFAGQDGWIIVAILACLATGSAYLMSSVGRLFPSESFVRTASKLLSKPAGKALGLIFAAKLILNCALEIRMFGEIIRQTMLPNTPLAVVAGAAISISAYAASKGYEARARIAQIIFPIIFIPLIIVFILALRQIDMTNLLPVFVAKPADIFRGTLRMGSAFSCMELILIAHPFFANPEKARKGASSAILLVGALMLFITIITIAKFGPFDVSRQLWPVLEMMDMVEMPGSFIERQDALMLSFWILSNFAITNSCLFFSSILLKDVIEKGRHLPYICVSALITAAIALMITNAEQVYPIIDFLFLTLGLGFMVVLPILLLVVARIRKKGVIYEKQT